MRNIYYDDEELNTEPSYTENDPDDRPDSYSEISPDREKDSLEDHYYSAESRSRTERSRKHRAYKVTAERILLILLGVIAGAAAAAYIVGCVYFSSHFGFHTSLNGTDVSLMNEEQVESLLTSEASDYTLTITGRNNVADTITGSEIDFKPTYGNSITNLIVSQDRLAWPKTLFTQTELASDSTASWNASKLTSVIDGLAFFDSDNVIAPTDASYELTSSGYQIVAADDGATPIKEAVTTAIENALYSFSATLTLDDSCYEKASITAESPQLTEEVNELNKLAGMTVSIPFGETAEALDGSTLGTWIVTADGSSQSLDQSKVSDYVASLAEKYDTYGKDRTFTTTNGDTVTVSGGSYGWLMDRNTTTANLIAFLQAGESGTFEVTWTQEAAQHGSNDIGSSYCEVDLDDQHVWVYVNGQQVVSTDCVSGKAVDADRVTPDGTYSIVYRKSPATLKGEGYESPVTYWMPFNRGIGFHDATWRSKFGGEIYLTSGSHGCINLPLDAAEEVYNNVYSGMPVVVYGGMTPEEAQEYTGQHPQTAESSSQTEDSSVTEGNVDEETRKAQEAAVIAQAVQNYVNQGMSEADAQAKVQQDLASQAADQLAAQQAAAAAAAQAAANQQAAAETADSSPQAAAPAQ